MCFCVFLCIKFGKLAFGNGVIILYCDIEHAALVVCGGDCCGHVFFMLQVYHYTTAHVG